MGLCSFGEGKEILGFVLVTVFDVKLCQYDLSVLQRYLKLLLTVLLKLLLTVFIAVLAINMLNV